MNPLTTSPKHVFLIDGSGFLFRAFYALPPLNRGDGTPVNAVLGFTNMLWAMLRETDADHVAVIFDSARKTFRNDIFPDYKANREAPPEELVPQFALVREAVQAFNVACIELQGFEADDLIATYTKMAREEGAKVTIVSSDKDLMQLVNEKNVVILDHFKNKTIGEEGVFEKFGVSPEKVIDVQALAGDSSDNVPGVPGIGIKTASQLINEYGDLDTLLERVDEIKQPKRRQSLSDNSKMALISRELVKLRDDVPAPVPLHTLAVKNIDNGKLLSFLNEQGFKSAAQRITSQLQGNSDQDSKIKTTQAVNNVNYTLVQSITDLKLWILKARENGLIALDTETTSLDPNRAILVGISLAITPGEACYIPIAHRSNDILKESEKIEQLPLAETLNELKPLLEDKSVIKIGQNIKYDMHIFARHQINIKPINDSMVMSFVLDGSLHGHGMDELAKIHLNVTTTSFKEVTGTGKNQITFDLVELKKARDYAAQDADMTLQLGQKLKYDLLKNHLISVYERLDRPLIPILMRMEKNGIKVDPTTLARLSNDFAKRMENLEAKSYTLVGRTFNIGSPKQLGEVLFDEMALPVGKTGKSGARSTSAEVLENLAAEGHELPPIILEWRQLTKLKNTYTDALVGHINPDSGRVHTSFSMTTAGTGRLSSSEPNLQNIPIRTEEGRKIRAAFIAEKDHKLLSADYSQIELRILAHIAKVDRLKQAFLEKIDIHALTASQVFKIPVHDMDPMIRRSAKAINFGIIYGISPFGLARQLGISRQDAKHYIESYFTQYPGIQSYMDTIIKTARSDGYVKTLFGRKCFIPGIRDKNPARRGFSERAAINAPIQGTAADIMKKAMIRVENALQTSGLKTKMLLQVHDELVFEVPDKELKEVVPIIKEAMETAANLDIPLIVETGIANDWEKAH